MKTPYGHLSYCSNIHTGEIWTEHFAQLQAHVPAVKAQVSPNQKMGLGLRFANQASIDLQDSSLISELKNWLKEENLYVFTLNGFPYGGFHNTIVKDQVHAPDWTTTDRRDYTIRLAHILAALLTENEGGISTSPLSYKYWWNTAEERQQAMQSSTRHLLEVVDVLAEIEKNTGKIIHIDIDPASIGKSVAVDVPIVGDVKRVVKEMIRELKDIAAKYRVICQREGKLRKKSELVEAQWMLAVASPFRFTTHARIADLP